MDKKVTVAQAGIGQAIEGVMGAAEGAKSFINRATNIIPGMEQVKTDPKDPDELKLSGREIELEQLNIDQQNAIAALGSFGLTPEQVIATAKDMMTSGLAEPKTVYAYLAELGTMGFGAMSSPGALLTMGKYMLEKSFGDPKQAIAYLKVLSQYASEVPEMDLMETAADIITKKANVVPLLYVARLGLPPDKQAKLGEIIKVLKFVQSPNRDMASWLWKNAKLRQKRRMWQQLLNIKANQTLTLAMSTANKKLAILFEKYFKAYDKDPRIKSLARMVSNVYYASTFLHTLANVSGVYGESYLNKRPVGSSTENTNRIAFASDDDTNMIRLSLGAPTTVPSTAPGTATPPAPPIPGGANPYGPTGASYGQFGDLIDGTRMDPTTQQEKNLLQQTNEVTKDINTLQNYVNSGQERAKLLAQQLTAETTTNDFAGAGADFDANGIANMGSLDPSAIEQSGVELRAISQKARDMSKAYHTRIVYLNGVVSNYRPGANIRPQFVDWIKSLVVNANTTWKTMDGQILNLERQGIFAQYFGPVQRKINILKPSLDAIKQQMAAYDNTGAFGELMQFTFYPMYQMQINIYRQMIALLYEGVSRVNQAQMQEKDNPNLSSWLAMLKTRLYKSIKTLQAEINAVMGKLAFQGLKGGGGSAQLSMASFNADILRTAEDKANPFNQSEDDDREEPHIFKEADNEIQDYWNDLLPLDKENPAEPKGYGDILEHPQEYRNDDINYKPKFTKNTKFIKYR